MWSTCLFWKQGRWRKEKANLQVLPRCKIVEGKWNSQEWVAEVWIWVNSLNGSLKVCQRLGTSQCCPEGGNLCCYSLTWCLLKLVWLLAVNILYWLSSRYRKFEPILHKSWDNLDKVDLSLDSLITLARSFWMMPVNLWLKWLWRLLQELLQGQATKIRALLW